MSETGLATFTFSKQMMYPKNWVSKYMADNGLSDVDPSLVDKISVPLIRFYYEVAG